MESRTQSPTHAWHLAPVRLDPAGPPQGPLRVSDVLSRPLFSGAQVIAGAQGLSRLVRWVHILEVADVQAFINGGELVLTTAASVGHSEEKFVRYVHQLIDGRVAALCVELGTAVQEIPPSVRHLADMHGFPLIVFPFQVRFVDITQDLHKLIVLQERHMLSEQDWLERLIRGEANDAGPWPVMGMQLRPDRRYRVAVMNLPKSKGHGELREPWIERKTDLAMLVRQAFQRQRLRVYLSIRIDSSIALLELEGTEEQWRPRVEAAVHQLQISLRSHGLPDALSVGLGQEMEGPVGARDSYREAMAASAFAHVRGQRVLFYEDAGVYRWIAPLARNGDALPIALVDLAAVIEYDRENHTQLLETLKVYLDCDRSKQQTAARLFIHRQTLYHRLEQLGRLLRADLDDPVQRLGVHLAVYAYLYHRQCGDGENISK